jgi:hypothetical protein
MAFRGTSEFYSTVDRFESQPVSPKNAGMTLDLKIFAVAEMFFGVPKARTLSYVFATLNTLCIRQHQNYKFRELAMLLFPPC